MIPEETYLKILRSSVKSPSSHNAQPWIFTKFDDGICIQPDFSRALPIADPNHRELFISLGCAAETTMIAARFFGYRPHLQINQNNNDYSINIALQKEDVSEQADLFSSISARQTTRNLYENKSIPTNDLRWLLHAKANENTAIQLFTLTTEIKQFGPFITEAVSLQMNNPEFKQELIQWLRFSEKEAMQKGDGLFTACSGVPSMGRCLGSLIVKTFATAKIENKKLTNQLTNSAAIALISSTGDNVEAWIKTGMSLQNFALTATMLNINHSYLNPPCQVPTVREKLQAAFCETDTFPQLIVRLGYSKKMPYALHKGISSLNYQS
jgi:hypothetical protein